MYKANRRFFKTIDTEEKAYFLGFMFADGCVFQNSHGGYSVQIKLHEKDKSILERFRVALKSEHPIYNHNYDNYKQCKFQIGSKQMAQDLIRHGCTPRKTFTIKFPTTIPDHLIRHFIRGYSDGDGCISWHYDKRRIKSIENHWTILGTNDFLQKIANILYEKFDIHYHISKRDNIYQLRIWRKLDFRECLDWIYKDSDKTLCLQRKHEKFEQWKRE